MKKFIIFSIISFFVICIGYVFYHDNRSASSLDNYCHSEFNLIPFPGRPHVFLGANLSLTDFTYTNRTIDNGITLNIDGKDFDLPVFTSIDFPPSYSLNDFGKEKFVKYGHVLSVNIPVQLLRFIDDSKDISITLHYNGYPPKTFPLSTHQLSSWKESFNK